MFGHLSFGQLMTLWYKGEIDTYLPPKELQTCPVFLLFFYFFVIFFLHFYCYYKTDYLQTRY